MVDIPLERFTVEVFPESHSVVNAMKNQFVIGSPWIVRYMCVNYYFPKLTALAMGTAAK